MEITEADKDYYNTEIKENTWEDEDDEEDDEVEYNDVMEE